MPVRPGEMAVLARPNPTQHSVCAVLDNALMGKVSLELFDQTGRLVRSQAREKRTEAWEGPMDVEGLAAGVYALVVRVGGKVFREKVVVGK